MAKLFTIDGHNYVVIAQSYPGEPPRWEVRDNDGIILADAWVSPCGEYITVENLNKNLIGMFYNADDMTINAIEREIAHIAAYDGV